MPSHLPFLDEAVDIFLEAFDLRQAFYGKKSSLSVAANCVRTLALALERAASTRSPLSDLHRR
jgi:hypothetical protein